MPLRVLIVTPAFPPGMHVGGGVAVTYKVLAEKLAALPDVEPKVLSTWNGALDYFHAVFDPEFRLIRLSGRNLIIIREALREADVVIFPDTMLLPWLALECYRHGVPSIWVLHTNFLRLAEHRFTKLEFKVYSWLTGAIFNRLSSYVTHVYTTSRDYLNYLHAQGMQCERYIDQGFKTDIFREDDPPEAVAALRREITFDEPDRPVLIFAGRFSNEKRIHLLIKAKPKRFILVLVGDGYLRDQLQEMHGSHNGIVVVSRMLPQSELRLYYKAADLVVSASDFETYGMTIHEGLLCGTPAVAQDAKGFRSQIRDSVNGFLVDYADAAAAASALERALTHKFDAQPVHDPEAISLVQAAQNVAAERRQPCGWLLSWVLLFVQIMYLYLARFISYWYTAKPSSRFSKLPTAPPSAKPKRT
jgi:glycosyltransferase involved in cell wall biosynthesis